VEEGVVAADVRVAMAEANTQQNGTQDEVAKIISCLIENGSTPSGPMLGFWELSRRTGIEGLELYRVIKSVVDVTETRKLLEADPPAQINSRSAEEKIGRGERTENPFIMSLRLSEVGVRLAKEEIGVRYQYKQLGDFDDAVERSRQSNRFSKVGIGISAVSMIIAGISLARTCHTGQTHEAPSTHTEDSTHSSHQTGAMPIPTDASNAKDSTVTP
jgi:hypothetical protein